MTRTVISDTSPIRALDWLGQLPLLGDLFEKVLLPPSVAHELLRCESRYREIQVTTLPFVEVRTPRICSVESRYSQQLQAGESEALSLALELKADVVLIDEAIGRLCAKDLGLNVLGTLGILRTAKSRGLLPELAPLVAELRSGLGFHLSDSLVQNFLKQVGEA